MRTARLMLLLVAPFLMAADDAPLRKAGTFSATITGVAAGRITGDASITRGKNGTRTLHLYMNTDEMMQLGVMISADIALTPGAPTTLNWQNVSTGARHAVQTGATLNTDGKDPMAGSFTITAKDGSESLSVTGTFKDAPIAPGLD